MSDCGQLWTRIGSCWIEMASALRRDGLCKSQHDCESAARGIVQLAAFVQLCRNRRLLPGDVSAESFGEALEIMRESFGSTLFQTHLDCPDGIDISVDSGSWRKLAAGLKNLDGPPEVLAQLHQRLLGLRLADDGQGGFRSVPEAAHKKAGGVFYTPDYVTRYIVEQSLSQTNLELPTILDPACGCGAFLLAAFRGLFSRCDFDRDDIPARLEVLRHIHGVDIDKQAVLAARRILWLEMFDNKCSTAALGRDSIVADFLAETVRVGDTLADDFQQTILGPRDTFDIIIGNPPYRRELGTKTALDRIAATDLGRRWRTARMDLWYYFVHRGLELLADAGTLNFIVSGYWTSGRGAEKLIDQLRHDAHIEEIFDLGDRDVFAGVAGRHMILRIAKGRSQSPTTIKRATDNQPPGEDNARSLLDGTAPLSIYQKIDSQLFRQGRIDIEPPSDELLAQISRGTPLGELGKVRQGIAENPAAINRRTNQKFDNRWTVDEGVFSLTQDEVASLDLSDAEKSILRPYHDLCDLGRYRIAEQTSRYVIYSTPDTWPRFDMFPVLGSHLGRFRPIMENRRETRQGHRPWWQLHWPRDESLWESAKIISVQMAARPAFVPANGPAYVPFSANVFVPDESVQEHLNYFAAVLNSDLLWQWYRHHAKLRGVGLEINGRVLSETPIRRIDVNAPQDRRHHDRLVVLVDQMLEADTENKETIDREIDNIVCELYKIDPASY